MSSLMEFQNELKEAVSKVEKSVVSINSVQIRQDQQSGDLFPVKGAGTGIIIGHSGYIITNNHVVEGSSGGIDVTLFDGRHFEGKIIGTDPATDVALLRIKAWDLPVSELGDSDKLKAGEIVLAVGNALGLPGSPTVSMGLISATGRPMPWADFVFEGLIQTDSAINPGNSGGPLCTIDGKVIGINTAMIPFAQGMGFAIPINSVKRVMDQILEFGKVIRPWLGISGIGLNKELSMRFGISYTDGVLIARITRNGPAFSAGLRAGDVISKIGGQSITNMRDLLEALSKQKIGASTEVIFSRGQERYRSNIPLEETPEQYLRMQKSTP